MYTCVVSVGGDDEGRDMVSTPSPEKVTRTLSPVENDMGTSTYTTHIKHTHIHKHSKMATICLLNHQGDMPGSPLFVLTC